MAILSRNTVSTSYNLGHPILQHFKFSTIDNTNMEAMQTFMEEEMLEPFNTESEGSCGVKPLQNKQHLFVECEIRRQQRKTYIPLSV
jgi:hypothetical protein